MVSHGHLSSLLLANWHTCPQAKLLPGSAALERAVPPCAGLPRPGPIYTGPLSIASLSLSSATIGQMDVKRSVMVLVKGPDDLYRLVKVRLGAGAHSLLSREFLSSEVLSLGSSIALAMKWG